MLTGKFVINATYSWRVYSFQISKLTSFFFYSAYCEECVKNSEQSSIFPHPERCDYYIQCVINKVNSLAYEKPCPDTLFFDPKLKLCTQDITKCNASKLIFLFSIWTNNILNLIDFKFNKNRCVNERVQFHIEFFFIYFSYL